MIERSTSNPELKKVEKARSYVTLDATSPTHDESEEQPVDLQNNGYIRLNGNTQSHNEDEQGDTTPTSETMK